MEISSFASQTSKLLDALEKLGTSPGAEFKSSGPSGTPSADLVKEFEMAIQEIDFEKLEALNNQEDFSGQDLSVFFQNDLNKPVKTINSDGEELNLEKVNQTQNSEQASLDLESEPSQRVQFREHDFEQRIEFENKVLEVDNSELRVNNNTKVENNIDNKTNSELSPDEILQELKTLMENISSGSVSPIDLYRAQYLTAMFSFQVKSTNKTAQQASQGLEQTLKQQS